MWVCLVKCRFSVVNYVVWWLMWVMFVVRVSGSMGVVKIVLIGLCL